MEGEEAYKVAMQQRTMKRDLRRERQEDRLLPGPFGAEGRGNMEGATEKANGSRGTTKKKKRRGKTEGQGQGQKNRSIRNV